MQKCQDSYFTTFSSYPMLLQFHEEQARNSQWIKCRVNELQVEPLDKDSPLLSNLPAFAPGTSQEAVYPVCGRCVDKGTDAGDTENKKTI